MKGYFTIRKNVPSKIEIEDIISRLCSLDGDLLKSLRKQYTPIIVVTTVPVSHIQDNEDDEDDYDDDDCDDSEDCLDYEPSGDGTGRCVCACPECGICLRDYIGEEFE